MLKRTLVALLSLHILGPVALAEDTVDSLHDLVSTPKMPYKMEQSFHYLFKLKGFNLPKMSETYEALDKKQPVTFTLMGGPTGEPIVYKIKTLDELNGLAAKVKAQKHRDQFRPDLSQVRNIVTQRSYIMKARLKEYQSKLSQEHKVLSPQIPQLESRIAQLQQNIEHLQKVLQATDKAFQAADRQYQNLKKDFDQWKAHFDKLDEQYDDLKGKYKKNYADRQDAVAKATYYWELSKQAETMIFKDPNNSATHRQNAQKYRQIAEQWHQRAERLKAWLNQTYPQLQAQKSKLAELKPQVDAKEQATQSAWIERAHAKGAYDKVFNENAALNKAQSDTFGRLQKTKADVAQIKTLQQSHDRLFKAVSTFENQLKGLQSYQAYAQLKPQVLANFKAMALEATRADFENKFGSTLKEALSPLLVMVRNMDKPALSS